jgi:hypothetical protein
MSLIEEDCDPQVDLSNTATCARGWNLNLKVFCPFERVGCPCLEIGAEVRAFEGYPFVLHAAYNHHGELRNQK